QAPEVTGLNRSTGIIQRNLQMALFDGEVRANCQAHKVVRVGKDPGLIKVIDAPNQPPFSVSPGAEVFDVQVTDGKNLRSPDQFRTDLGPALSPTVICRPEKQK